MASGSVMAELGRALMPAPPQRPMEYLLLAWRGRQQDALNEVTDFGNRQRNEVPLFFGAVGPDA